jgi:hypothetical protein
MVWTHSFVSAGAYKLGTAIGKMAREIVAVLVKFRRACRSISESLVDPAAKIAIGLDRKVRR